jgi:GNAT superfamily N-acetyltransferase
MRIADFPIERFHCRSYSARESGPMQQKIHIRPATVTDSPAISPLLQQLGYRMPPDSLAEKLSANAAGRFAFVAEMNGRIAGFMTLHVIDWFHRPDAAARLSAVVVDTASRRMGVGRALVAFAETRASQMGCSYIELTSSLRRRPGGTYAFYDSLGYRSAQDETTYFRKALR